LNAAAASCAAIAAGASLAHIQTGLEKLDATPGRLEVKAGLNGARIIDDTYNANPASVAVALDVLADFGGERVLVFGDMGELGDTAEAAHRDVAKAARAAGVSKLYATGALSQHTVNVFGAGARHFADREALAAALVPQLHAGMTVLVKGSRSAGMEKVTAALIGKLAGKSAGASH
jgi:UDP-N-acetylmuramoyl-tripeptide--D-alanyl-D-alanine ligase